MPHTVPPYPATPKTAATRKKRRSVRSKDPKPAIPKSANQRWLPVRGVPQPLCGAAAPGQRTPAPCQGRRSGDRSICANVLRQPAPSAAPAPVLPALPKRFRQGRHGRLPPTARAQSIRPHGRSISSEFASGNPPCGRGADRTHRPPYRDRRRFALLFCFAGCCPRRCPHPRRAAAHTAPGFGTAQRRARQTTPAGRARKPFARRTATNRFGRHAGSRANRHADAGQASLCTAAL